MARRPAPDKSSSEFIEHLGVLMEADGLPRVAGRLFGLLLLAPDSRSLDELADQLGVSKPSVSVNARLLEQRGVVERVSRQGDRRDYYRIAGDILERSLEQRMIRMRRFQEALASACSTCGTGNAAVRARLDNMAQAYEHMLDVIARALSEWRLGAATRATHSPARSR